jgi:isoleucyl-tRNA synthetase
LINFSKIAAPMLPFICDEIYVSLAHFGKYGKLQSVHLTEYPAFEDQSHNKLIKQMDLVREICSSALFIRNEENLKIRLPLNKISLYGKDLEFLESFTDLIKDELNIKNIEIFDDVSMVADYKLKINYRLLGKRLPNSIKEITNLVKEGKWQINSNNKMEIAGLELLTEEYELLLEPKEKKGSGVVSGGNLLILLDINVTQELLTEGIARDLIREIQQARKDGGLHIADRVIVTIVASEILATKLNSFVAYIGSQTLGQVIFTSQEPTENLIVNEVEIEGEKIKFYIKKIV